MHIELDSYSALSKGNDRNKNLVRRGLRGLNLILFGNPSMGDVVYFWKKRQVADMWGTKSRVDGCIDRETGGLVRD